MTESVNLPDDFVQGMVRYSDKYPGSQDSRIVIGVRLGNILTQAVVDTGAPWCIFDPALVKRAGVDYQQHFQDRPMIVRKDQYKGWLCRIPIRLEAEKGESLAVESTVFVPKLEESQSWNNPNFIGLSGFLERVCFAVDPRNNLFYFGSINSI